MRAGVRAALGGREEGFTLAEALVVLVLMGVMLGIAAPAWSGVVESNRLDAGTNQLVSDLRLAHERAANRLVHWRVEFDPGAGTYRVGPAGGTLVARSLPEGAEFSTTVRALEFAPDGAARAVDAAGNPVSGVVGVAAEGREEAVRAVEVDPVTSRVKVAG